MFEHGGGDLAALQRARDVLSLAERRTGVQSRREASVSLPPASDHLTSILPQRALPRGAVVAVIGAPGLLAQILGATQKSGWLAVVGWPQLDAVRMAEAGVDLEHAVVIPDPGSKAAGVVAGLLDGFDQVVVGPHLGLAPGERRQLLARARRHESTLLTSKPWDDAALQLQASSIEWSGPDRGDHWLRKVRYELVRASRWDARERRFEVTVDWSDAVAGESLAATVRVQEMASVRGVLDRPVEHRAARVGS